VTTLQVFEHALLLIFWKMLDAFRIGNEFSNTVILTDRGSEGGDISGHFIHCCMLLHFQEILNVFMESWDL